MPDKTTKSDITLRLFLRSLSLYIEAARWQTASEKHRQAYETKKIASDGKEKETFL
jgi:hypothetical protein